MIIDDYIRYIGTARRYSPRTLEVYRDILDRFSAFAGEGSTVSDEVLLDSLKGTMLRAYEVKIMEEGLSPRTVNLHLSVLSGLCRYLIETGRLRTNPVKGLTRPKMQKRLPEVFRKEAVDAYLKDTAYLIAEYDALHGGSDYRKKFTERLIINILYCTGIRRAELISLRVGSFDPKRRILSVRGKGDKMRDIPLVVSLCQEISLYLTSVESTLGCVRTADDPLLLTDTGRPLYPMYVERVVKDVFAAGTGIAGRRSPHVLRHTIATELLDEGADLNSIKEMLGHASLAATQVYTHTSAERLKKVYANAHPRAKNGGKNGDQS